MKIYKINKSSKKWRNINDKLQKTLEKIIIIIPYKIFCEFEITFKFKGKNDI